MFDLPRAIRSPPRGRFPGSVTTANVRNWHSSDGPPQAPQVCNKSDSGQPVRKRSRRRHERVEQRLDVAVAIGEGEIRRAAAVNLRDMVRHQHVGVPDLATGTERAGYGQWPQLSPPPPSWEWPPKSEPPAS